jgi:hypothetical protein
MGGHTLKKDTALAYLMDLLEVGGKELAIEIKTDTTTISKWRTGKRKLSYGSDSCLAIASFFLSDRFSFCREEMEARLDRVIDGFSALSDEDKIEKLCFFLSRGDRNEKNGALCGKDMISYRAEMQVYSGDYEGWKSSLEQFWNVARSSDKTEITLCDFGDIDWSTTEPERFLLTSDCVIDCVQRGHRVCIIDILGDSYRSYETLDRWMDMYMTEGVDVRYIIGNFTDAEKGNYYCIKDKLALIGYYFEQDLSLLTYTHYTDYRMLNYYQARVGDYVASSKPVFDKLLLAEHMETVSIMEKNLTALEPTYMIGQAPTYINMPPELLCEILESNGVDQAQINRCEDTLAKRHQIRRRCKYIQMYDIDTMEERLRHDKNEAAMLSRIIGRPIFITKKQYLRQLQYIAESVELGEMEIDLISFRDTGVKENGISVVAQLGRLAIVWNGSKYNNLIYSTEPTYIGGFVSYLEDLYSRIPPMNKNMDWVKQRLRGYVENG